MIFTCLFKFKGSHWSSLGSQVFRLQPLGPIYSQHHLLTEMKTSEICYFTSDFSQMQTCVFANSTFFSQMETCVCTNTNRSFHKCQHVFSQIQTFLKHIHSFLQIQANCFTCVNMCLHKYKQILSQMQMFSQIKTQQNCFRYVDRKASSDSWPPPPTNEDENM